MLETTAHRLAFLPAWRLAEAIRSGAMSSRALLETYLERIERYDGLINAVVTRDFAGARAAADRADRFLAKGGEPGPLHGVPITIKDTYDVEGLPSTWGLVSLKANIPARSARFVEALRAAGAVLIGKTNVPPYCQGWQTANDLFGVTHNPWDLTRSPGGSSGGGAAALAAGLTALDFGSDVAGSLRNPAHFCGVFSHRPTYGIVDFEGHEFPGAGILPDLAVTGPMARSARDLRRVLPLMAGPRQDDAIAWQLALPGCAKQSLSEFRIAMMVDAPHARVDREVREALVSLADRLRCAGADVTLDAFPDLDPEVSHQTFMSLAEAATAASMPDREFTKASAIAMVLGARNRSAGASYIRNVTMRHRTWIEHDQMRRHIQAAWAAFFRRFDLFLCPAAATPAVPHSPKRLEHQRTIMVDGVRVPALEQVFWAGLASVAGLPVTTAPVTRSGQGLPIGVQILGPRFADDTCLSFAERLEQEHGGFLPPDGYP